MLLISAEPVLAAHPTASRSKLGVQLVRLVSQAVDLPGVRFRELRHDLGAHHQREIDALGVQRLYREARQRCVGNVPPHTLAGWLLAAQSPGDSRGRIDGDGTREVIHQPDWQRQLQVAATSLAALRQSSLSAERSNFGFGCQDSLPSAKIYSPPRTDILPTH